MRVICKDDVRSFQATVTLPHPVAATITGDAGSVTLNSTGSVESKVGGTQLGGGVRFRF